jgi:hypothetical protein
MNFYTYTGENIKSEEYQIDRIIFEGETSEKEVLAGVPVILSEDEVHYLHSLGFVLDKSSEVESEAVQSAIKDWQESDKVSDDFVNQSAVDSGLIHSEGVN